MEASNRFTRRELSLGASLPVSRVELELNEGWLRGGDGGQKYKQELRIRGVALHGTGRVSNRLQQRSYHGGSPTLSMVDRCRS
ncbi:hypothetical protein BGZ72_001697 [Mortierella alpina]|nr:hypothetical protein BGZ72_001697 [Mortierella alpina]